jgi:nicotinate-nucleotide pyrophosphorylase (carboxylating)
MKTVDNAIDITKNYKDGDAIDKGSIIATIAGPSKSILSAERVALNLIQRMSGISTATATLVAQVSSTKTKIADTRKTTPGLRMLEKYAVRIGGGSNHRYNLADGVLIKDNHISAAGGITNAVTAARAYIPHTVKIEVETESLEQVQEALDCGADIIMLDNMDNATMKKAVELIGGRALTEASGNMGELDLLEVAKTGVDIISIGALTHTVKAMDISLRF